MRRSPMANETLIEEIAHLCREHAARLLSDVELAASREEHVRLTARANEAQTVVDRVQELLLAQYK